MLPVPLPDALPGYFQGSLTSFSLKCHLLWGGSQCVTRRRSAVPRAGLSREKELLLLDDSPGRLTQPSPESPLLLSFQLHEITISLSLTPVWVGTHYLELKCWLIQVSTRSFCKHLFHHKILQAFSLESETRGECYLSPLLLESESKVLNDIIWKKGIRGIWVGRDKVYYL